MRVCRDKRFRIYGWFSLFDWRTFSEPSKCVSILSLSNGCDIDIGDFFLLFVLVGASEICVT